MAVDKREFVNVFDYEAAARETLPMTIIEAVPMMKSHYTKTTTLTNGLS